MISLRIFTLDRKYTTNREHLLMVRFLFLMTIEYFQSVAIALVVPLLEPALSTIRKIEFIKLNIHSLE